MGDKKMDPNFIVKDNPDDFEGEIPPKAKGDFQSLVETESPDDSEIENSLTKN